MNFLKNLPKYNYKGIIYSITNKFVSENSPIHFFLYNMKQRINEELLKEIALRIKGLREGKKLSQAEFLIETDINIARIEVAKNNMTISTLKAICDYFKISLSDFLKDIPISEFSNEQV